MSEIRYDRLHDTHVIVAPERLHRPESVRRHAPKRPLEQVCPFCEGNESMTPPEIMALRDAMASADTPGWKTRIVPNLYSAVQTNASFEYNDTSFVCLDGFGTHEVLVDTPTHVTAFVQLDERQIIDWLETIGERVRQLRQDDRFAYIAVFKNEGADAGATQSHVHTQILGIPFVPAWKRVDVLRAHRYFEEHGTALHAAVLEDEITADERVVYQKNGWVAYCPFASAVPYEVIIAADDLKGQVDTFTREQVHAVAAVIKTVMSGMQKALGEFDYNLEIAVPPMGDLGVRAETTDMLDRIAPFHIRILPRLFRFGGFETATGVMINPVTPEDAAMQLRGDE